jgi:hypothetical protein
MNSKCKVSIYNSIEEIQIPFTLDNLVETHLCACCNQPLVSSMDIEIKQMVAEVYTPKKIKIKKTSFFDN